tara:strand:+ start:5376 stop:5630 length:255 start_codon:yes stop_codon:yes gene_type:complete
MVKEVDAMGLICPEPIMLLHKAVNESSHEEIIKIYATDPTAEKDIEKFCHFLGHKLIKKEIKKEKLYFIVQKVDKNIIDNQGEA